MVLPNVQRLYPSRSAAIDRILLNRGGAGARRPFDVHLWRTRGYPWGIVTVVGKADKGFDASGPASYGAAGTVGPEKMAVTGLAAWGSATVPRQAQSAT